MFTILVRLSMSLLAIDGMRLPVDFISAHQILIERLGQFDITCRREMHEVPLSKSGVDPFAHRTLSSHTPPCIPKCASILTARSLLRGDDAINTGMRNPRALAPCQTIGRPEHDDR